jgi:putative two-component system hydrogenase maturation factor HypX/HoxX
MRQADRRIDWDRDDTATVLRKIRAADSVPGVADEIGGVPVRLYDACEERHLQGRPGDLLARRGGALCRATVDGAIWIGHLKRGDGDEPGFKLPATAVLPDVAATLPDLALPVLPQRLEGTWQDISYEESDKVGYLHFPFYNGAMSTAACLRLRDAFAEATRRDVRVLVLMGGPDFWSNGIHLNVIEAAASPADESWANIEAMDDLCLAIMESPKPTVAAMQGNAGAGGVFLALTCDKVWARTGVVLNPHYKGMGNLYGSEYWTYLLPRRVGSERAAAITENRLPVGAPEAVELGLIDACFGRDVPSFIEEMSRRAAAWAADPVLDAWIVDRDARRGSDQARKPLAAYRAEELARMKLNFYGFDPSYHVARYHFVHRVPHAWTPLHLARHRRRMWERQELLRTRR